MVDNTHKEQQKDLLQKYWEIKNKIMQISDQL